MTTDTDAIDRRAAELYDLATARICATLDITPAQ
jgi:hypothetical protein